MKRVFTIAIVCCLVLAASAQTQTLNVRVGQVNYVFKTASVGEMKFVAGSSLVINGKAFGVIDSSSASDDFIDEISLGVNEVADNTVDVVYNGSTANVVVAGNIASKLKVTATGAAVSVVQDESLQQEVTYTLIYIYKFIYVCIYMCVCVCCA